jgi:SRSO17 transposase
MLPLLTLPAGLLEVLEVCRGAFTAPAYATFVALVTGYLGATGRRTVTGMWIAAGLAAIVHHSRAHRFFSHSRWSADTVGLLLARAVIATLLPAGAAAEVVIDDTLFHRYGKKVFAAKWQHDGSARGRDGLGRGNCFVVAGLVVTVAGMTRPVCLPVLFRCTSRKPRRASRNWHGSWSIC